MPDGHPCLNGRRPSEAQSAGAGGAVVEVRFADAVTSRTAFALCQSIRSHLADSPRTLVLNLEEVKAVDVVGLAALLQMTRLARQLGVPFAILPSVAIRRGLISAELVEEVPVVSDPGQAPLSAVGARDLSPPDALTPFLAATPRVGLRQPAWEELSIFADWANNSLLQEMVGSELLYRCRHLGPYHPDFVASIFSDPTSLTLLVQPVPPPAPPVGFVRLYDIRLVEQLGFLETAIADPRSLRRGWGVEASRLLLAFAMDVLAIRRVEAKVYAYNTLSINALKRNGFQQDGRLRQAKTYEGRHWDILVFSILEDELHSQRELEQFPYMGFRETGSPSPSGCSRCSGAA